MNRRFYCDDRTVVETAAGKVRGCFLNDHYYFRGIPYADAKRYQMPTPVEHWDGVLDAVTYGPVAPTVNKPGVLGLNALTQEPLFGYRFWPEDEKCQYINVWTKKPDPDAKRPVMVWVHGGGFSSGSSVEQMSYDGANLCRDGDLVVVSFNHRLNILGYLDLSDFGERYHNSGNVGMVDIIEALKWVQKNIAAFGGDPDNVTLFGQSGGGRKIRALMQMTAADGLYHRAIFQSGLLNQHDETESGEMNRLAARMTAEKLGLTKETITEIETVPLEKLYQAYRDVNAEFGKKGLFLGGAIGPAVNEYYPGLPTNVGFTEYAKTVPIMAGSVQAESVLYARKFYPYTESAEKRQELLTEMFGDKKDELIEAFEKAYPGSDLMDLYNLDYISRKSVLEHLDLKAEYDAPCYCYLLTLHLNYFGGMPAYHGMCLPLVFGTTEYVDGTNEPDAVALSQKMHQAWINFATNGDPNGGDVPRWEPYTKENHRTMIFDKKCEMRGDFDKELIQKFEDATDFRNPFMRV